MINELNTEWVLIENAKSNPQGFEPIYKKYYQQILNFTYKRLDAVEDAYDVTANTFVKALTNIGKYQHQGLKFSSWLYRIAINEINQFYRDSSKKRTVNINDAAIQYMAQETGQDKQELNEALKTALHYLNVEEMQLLELRFFEERPFAEVAEILGITENNAKVRTYRVIDKLKTLFTKVN